MMSRFGAQYIATSFLVQVRFGIYFYCKSYWVCYHNQDQWESLIYDCESGIDVDNVTVQKEIKRLPHLRCAIFMLAGGHFAGAIFTGNKCKLQFLFEHHVAVGQAVYMNNESCCFMMNLSNQFKCNAASFNYFLGNSLRFGHLRWFKLYHMSALPSPRHCFIISHCLMQHSSNTSQMLPSVRCTSEAWHCAISKRWKIWNIAA